jgi:hypothetical protein
MTVPPLAHAGHWTGLIYAIPVLVVAGIIGVDAWRERRRERAERDGPPPDG